MIVTPKSWNPYCGRSWASVLGLVHVPMFGMRDSQKLEGEHAILLDGTRGSFALSHSSDRDLLDKDTALSWIWSSHVRHNLILDDSRGVMHLRRWDTPNLLRRFHIPQQEQGAIDFLKVLQKVEPLQVPNVIQYVLYAFRLIRGIPCCSEPLWAVRLLNGLLLATDEIRANRIDRQRVIRARTFGETLGAMSVRRRKLAEVADLPKKIRDQDVGVLNQFFLERDPRTGLELLPDLLFRHASSKLYQEAHLQIERNPQLSFPGMGSIDEPTGTVSRDIRFTPPNLARALVQQAIKALGKLPPRLIALDPACGSGIFLQECLRELSLRNFEGRVNVVGYDISEVSACMSRFCLKHTADDLSGNGMKIAPHIEQNNSLQREWDSADLILMNPPFIPVNRLDPVMRDDLKSVLGDMFKGRADIAMGFVWKAARSLKPGGVLASVLPAALLHGRSGQAWREQLQQEGELLMLGRFDGYRYFPTSMVETGFILFRRKRRSTTRKPPVEIVVAREGYEDAALRALRLPEDDLRRSNDEVQVFTISPDESLAESWRPLRKSAYEYRRSLLSCGYPTVESLFDIRQGVRIGDKKSFVLDAYNLKQLRKEKSFFRPAVGGETLRNGQLVKSEFIFFPYGPDGLLLRTEKDLQENVPKYYKNWLRPNKKKLASRVGVGKWWELTRPGKWQMELVPRIVSTYFGASGSFAFDVTGEYAVVNGFAWIWKKPLPEGLDFGRSRLPWAYLALLNSSVFERVLSWFSVPLQGGQMRLERRFLGRIPLPDFSDNEQIAPDVLQDLVNLGKSINQGKLEDIRTDLDKIASTAYGLPADSSKWG